MPLDPTVGGADANTYADFTEFQEYWNSRGFSTAALAAEEASVGVVLMWAARLLDSLFIWTGAATDGVQRLAWPRTGMRTANGYALDSDVIPRQLKEAQCEYAGLLLGKDWTADNPALKTISSNASLTSLRAGSVSFSFDRGVSDLDEYMRSLSPAMAYLGRQMPDSVRLLLPPSWYTRATLKRPILFATNSNC